MALSGEGDAKARVDPRLYVLIDPAACEGRAPEAVAADAVAGGATLIQLRAKTASTRELFGLAERLRGALTPFGVPLLVNDRVDVALAAGAAGVHLGQDDLPVGIARRLLGPRALIGLTVRSRAEAEAAPVELVDYLAIGGVFATASKDNPSPPIGLGGLAELAAILRGRTRRPLVAIAGIDSGNAAGVIACGVDGVAVIGAVCRAHDVREAARTLRGVVDAARAQKQEP